MAGGAHHEHVAEALIEDDLGGHPAVGAAEQRGGGLLRRRPGWPGAATLWLGCSGWPATNRSLPSLSAFHAVTGSVFGMAVILP